MYESIPMAPTQIEENYQMNKIRENHSKFTSAPNFSILLLFLVKRALHVVTNNKSVDSVRNDLNLDMEIKMC